MLQHHVDKIIDEQEAIQEMKMDGLIIWVCLFGPSIVRNAPHHPELVGGSRSSGCFPLPRPGANETSHRIIPI